MATTVSEMYDQLKYWIGEEVDALYLVNTAIRFIAKRLYVLDSELVIGIMEVPVFTSVTITGSDIAFVDGGATADTITQTAAGFVTSGFQAGMPVTGSVTNPGPFRLVTVAAGTLTLHDDDSVTSESSGSSITLTSEDAFGYLPADFWGLWGQPYLDGKTVPLIPLPGVESEIQFTGPGVPYYYKIRGSRIYVSPHTGTDYTIKADYFQKPTTIENTTDYLPWDDLFNDIIYEIVTNLFKKSGILVPELQAIFNAAIDLIAVKRGKKAPRQLPRGIDYSNYK
jgi:hypothetical protein